MVTAAVVVGGGGGEGDRMGKVEKGGSGSDVRGKWLNVLVKCFCIDADLQYNIVCMLIHMGNEQI